MVEFCFVLFCFALEPEIRSKAKILFLQNLTLSLCHFLLLFISRCVQQIVEQGRAGIKISVLE